MKKLYKLSLIVTVTIILFSYGFVNAQQHITSNTTWSTDQIITQPIIVDSGIVLTINEGVKVQTTFVDINADQIGDVYIEVKGKLVINGNPCNPVIFRPYNSTSNKKYWEGIIINSSQNNNLLKYFEVYNAYKGIKAQTTAEITGAKIFNCSFSGLSVEFTSTLSNLYANNIILKNDSIGIDIINSSNIKIDWAKVDSCMGDGIAINNSQNVKISNSLVYNNKGHGIFSDLSSWSLTDSRVRLSSYFGISNSRSIFNMSYCDIDTNNWSGVMIGAGSNANINYSSIFSNQGNGFDVTEWYLDKFFNAGIGSNPIVFVNNSNITNNYLTAYNENNRKIYFGSLPNFGSYSNPIPVSYNGSNGVDGPIFEIPFGWINYLQFTARTSDGTNGFYVMSYYRLKNQHNSNIIMNLSYNSIQTTEVQLAGSVLNSNYDQLQLNMFCNQVNNKYLAMYNLDAGYFSFGKYELNSSVSTIDNLNFKNNYWGVISGVDSLINDVNGTNVNYSGYSPTVINTAHSTIYNNNISANNFPIAVISTNTNNTYICGTGNLTLNAPTGIGLQYNWYYNNTNINDTNQIYTATITGNYKLNISNSSGCNITTPNITVLQKSIINPVISTSNNLQGCIGDTVTLTSSNINGASYQYFNGNNIISNGNNKIYKATTSGTYNVVVTDSVSQCQATSNSINTSIIPFPTISASTQGLPIINCTGGYKDITASATGTNLHYLWKLNDVAITNSDTSVYRATQQGAYIVIVTNANGCKDTSTAVNISNNNLPGPTINLNTGDTTICNGNTITLTANGGVSYLWTPASGLNTFVGNTVIASPTINTSYIVTGTGSNGCTSSKSVNINIVNAVPSNAGTISGANNICQGQGLFTYTVPIISNATTYVWTLPNGVTGNSITNTINANFASNAQSGNITVKGSNSCGFSNLSTIAVTVNPIPSAPTVSNSISYCKNASTIPLTATGSNLLWYSASSGGIGSGTAPTPVSTIAGTTNYYVSQTINACESSRSQIAVIINAIPNTPTVTAAIAYCQNTTATALTATGSNLLWYTTAIGGVANASAPTPSTSNVGTINYYVSQTTNNCESMIAQIAVTINAIPSAPTVINSFTYCQNSTSTQLSATGSSLKWYTTSMGGTASTTAPIPSTSIVGTTNYYVSQTTNNCESPRAQVIITVNAIPSTPTVTNTIAYCKNTTATALAATGSNLLWYTTATGGTSISTAPTPLTTIVGTTNYYVSQTINNCESSRAQIAVTINTIPSTPTVTNTITYCQNAATTLLNATGSNLLWYNTATGGNGSVSNPTPSTATVGITNYYVSQTLNNCESPRAQIDVIVNETPNIPSVTSSVTYCQNISTSPLTATGSNLLWYTSITGGIGNSVAPTPTSSSTGNTNYYVSQTVNGCESQRAQIIVTINAIPGLPSVTNNVSYCQNETPSPLMASGTYMQWYNAPVGGSGNLSVPTPSTSTTGITYYYVSQTINGCESSRAQIVVTVNAIPSIPLVVNTVSYCQNNTSVALSASGNNLLWYTNLIGGTGNVSIPIPSTSIVGVTDYYVSQTVNGCESQRAQITVIINPIPNIPTVTNTINYCQNNTSSALSALGNNLLWYTNSTGGTGFANSPVPSTSIVGTTNYYVSQTINSCESQRAQIEVIVNANPGLPTVNNYITYCHGNISIALNATGANLLWYNIAAGGIGNPSAPIPSTSIIGSANYYVSQTTNGCESQRAEIVVNINPIPQTPIITQNGNTLYSNSTVGNQWYLSSTGLIFNATGQTFTPQLIGDYFAIVTISGCSSDSSNILHYDNTGIDAINNNKNIKVYPNPFNNELIIEMQGNKEKLDFEILNSIGQSVYKGKLIDKTIVQTFDFAGGVYLIKLNNGKTYQFKKIVKE